MLASVVKLQKKVLALVRECGWVGLMRAVRFRIVLPFRLGARALRDLLYDWSFRRRMRVAPKPLSMVPLATERGAQPLFSIILPTFESSLVWLQDCVNSVRAQTYPFWELCVSDDASQNSELRAYLENLSALDGRIKVLFRKVNGHISANSNSALTLATGDWIAFLDHDDLLCTNALWEMADFIKEKGLSNESLAFIYSDEDKVSDSGHYGEPARKTSWNTERLFSTMFTGHLAVYSRRLIKTAAGLREGFEGAQDWDLLLRAAEVPGFCAFHLPKILYHWRKHSNSTASHPESKPYAHEASLRALLEAFERRGLTMLLDSRPGPGFYRWKKIAQGNHVVAQPPALSFAAKGLRHVKQRLSFARLPKNLFEIPLIINNRDRLTYLRMQLDCFERRGFKNIIILDNDSSYQPLLDFYRDCPHEVIRLGQNIGYLALWQSGVFSRFQRSFYLYTDSDLLIDPMCPDDFLERFVEALRRYPSLDKVGLGLRIDDLPVENVLQKEIQAHEQSLVRESVDKVYFAAPIDTTFALYRPEARGGYWINAFRMATPYLLRHLPWYEVTGEVNVERDFYLRNARKKTHWTERSRDTD